MHVLLKSSSTLLLLKRTTAGTATFIARNTLEHAVHQSKPNLPLHASVQP